MGSRWLDPAPIAGPAAARDMVNSKFIFKELSEK